MKKPAAAEQLSLPETKPRRFSPEALAQMAVARKPTTPSGSRVKVALDPVPARRAGRGAHRTRDPRGDERRRPGGPDPRRRAAAEVTLQLVLVALDGEVAGRGCWRQCSLHRVHVSLDSSSLIV